MKPATPPTSRLGGAPTAGETAAAPSPPELQRSLSRAVEAEGMAVHGGQAVRLRLEPAPPDTGIVFERSDLTGAPSIRVSPDRVDRRGLKRMTVLRAAEDENVQVGMVEHLLAACAGLGVWNLRARVDGPECPIFDGSALPYAELILSAGPATQTVPQRRWRLARPVAVWTDRGEVIALPAERTRLTTFTELARGGMPDQQATFVPDRDDFLAEIAPARTWCFEDEVQALREDGLIRGGSLDCAVVLRDGGPVGGSFRLQGEPARHKLLDLMGDLAVLGRPVAAMISARAAGHSLHQAFIAELRRHLIDA